LSERSKDIRFHVARVTKSADSSRVFVVADRDNVWFERSTRKEAIEIAAKVNTLNRELNELRELKTHLVARALTGNEHLDRRIDYIANESSEFYGPAYDPSDAWGYDEDVISLFSNS
jgi:hypothetical protein